MQIPSNILAELKHDSHIIVPMNIKDEHSIREWEKEHTNSSCSKLVSTERNMLQNK